MQTLFDITERNSLVLLWGVLLLVLDLTSTSSSNASVAYRRQNREAKSIRTTEGAESKAGRLEVGSVAALAIGITLGG